VARLLEGAEPTLLSTDPPYGVSLDPTWRDGVDNATGDTSPPRAELNRCGRPPEGRLQRGWRGRWTLRAVKPPQSGNRGYRTVTVRV
jgi:hypothetical protein